MHIRRRIVEEELCREVEEPRRIWVELEADKREGFPSDLADLRVGFESASGVSEDIVLDGRVACVVQLDGLVDRFTWATRREGDAVTAHLDHRDEGLRSRSERMAT